VLGQFLLVPQVRGRRLREQPRERRREVAGWYRELLKGCEQLTLSPELPWARSSFWMNCVLLAEDARVGRDEVMALLAKAGVETRPFFYPLHTLPPFRRFANAETYPVADSLARRGLNLPSGALLSRDDVEYVAEAIRAVVS